VVVDFKILRDGTIKDIRVKTSSGNTALDRSAERALYDVAKVDPLPQGFDRNEAEVEFLFELKR
jgi:TonB family protein